jgi:hypothetical protein
LEGFAHERLQKNYTNMRRRTLGGKSPQVVARHKKVRGPSCLSAMALAAHPWTDFSMESGILVATMIQIVPGSGTRSPRWLCASAAWIELAGASMIGWDCYDSPG